MIWRKVLFGYQSRQIFIPNPQPAGDVCGRKMKKNNMAKKKIEREVYSFKKGEIIHLDEFIKVSGFVQLNDRTMPYQNKYISDSNYNPDLTDEYKVTKSFTVEVIVTLINP